MCITLLLQEVRSNLIVQSDFEEHDNLQKQRWRLRNPFRNWIYFETYSCAMPSLGHYCSNIVFDMHIKYLSDQKQYCQWGDQTSSHDNSNEEKLEQWRERGGYLQLKPPSSLACWYIRPRWYPRPGMISYDVWISDDMCVIYNDIYGYGYHGLDIMLADIYIHLSW